MTRSLHKTLLAAAIFAGAGWSPLVHPGRTADGPATASVIASPGFSIAVRHGIVTLAGHTLSRDHETRLQQAVVRHFPNREHVFEFRPFGPVPDWWTDATLALIGVAASMHAPRIKLDDTGIVVRALAGQPASAREGVVAIARALRVALETDIRVLDSGPGITARSLCARHFMQLRNGSIHFFESQTQMRPSAYPELERIVALAAACRGATISIRGHTDASGSEAWNQRLSRERALAVGDWLVTRGVATERIVAAGVGSSEPVASNETRYGRSLNRRIDIAFAYED